MKTLLTGGRVLRPDGTFSENCPVLWENGELLAVGDASAAIPHDRVLDAAGQTVLPGLVDVHTHGRAGYDFCTATRSQMQQMKRDYARHGVTAVFATLASGSCEEWSRAIADIKASGYEGIHLEGRYLNPQKRGAHAPHLLAPLDASELERFLLQIGDFPCHISAAFELDRDGSFAETALRHGATLGLGHTAATAAETRAAMARGVTAFTHLYNAMPPLHHREAGPVGVAFLGSGWGEIIADGEHICPDMVALAYRNLGGARTVLITDSMEGTGCPNGMYSIAGQQVELKNGRAQTLYGALAGSTLNLWQGVKNLMRFADTDLAAAVLCATRNPAQMTGIYNCIGSIEQGKRADLLLVDGELNIQTVICQGETVKGVAI